MADEDAAEAALIAEMLYERGFQIPQGTTAEELQIFARELNLPLPSQRQSAPRLSGRRPLTSPSTPTQEVLPIAVAAPFGEGNPNRRSRPKSSPLDPSVPRRRTQVETERRPSPASVATAYVPGSEPLSAGGRASQHMSGPAKRRTLVEDAASPPFVPMGEASGSRPGSIDSATGLPFAVRCRRVSLEDVPVYDPSAPAESGSRRPASIQTTLLPPRSSGEPASPATSRRSEARSAPLRTSLVEPPSPVTGHRGSVRTTTSQQQAKLDRQTSGRSSASASTLLPVAAAVPVNLLLETHQQGSARARRVSQLEAVAMEAAEEEERARRESSVARDAARALLGDEYMALDEYDELDEAEILNDAEYRGALMASAHESKILRTKSLGKNRARAQMEEEEARWDAHAGTGAYDDFAAPSRENAKRYAALHQPRKMGGAKFSFVHSTMGRLCCRAAARWRTLDLFGEGSVSELSRYGTGVSLHFKILKLLFWVFFIATFLAVPQLFLNHEAAEQSISKAQTSTNGLFLTTLGNARLSDQVIAAELNRTGGDVSDLTSSTMVHVCVAGNAAWCYDLTRAQMALVYTYSNVTIVILFILSLLWMRYWTEIEHAQISKLFLSVEQYSVYFPKIPPACTEVALARFLEEATGERVDEVSIARDNAALIHVFQDRGDVIQELWKVVGRSIAMAEAPIKETALLSKEEAMFIREEKLERTIDYYDTLLAHYTMLGEQLSSIQGGKTSIAAVVTFENQIGFYRALDLFRPKRFSWLRLARKLWRRVKIWSKGPNVRASYVLALMEEEENDDVTPRFQRVRLAARPAPPAATLLWENIEVSKRERVARLTATTFISLSAIGASMGAVYIAQAYRQELEAATSDSCDLTSLGLAANATVVELASLLTAALGNGTDPSEGLLSCYCGTLDAGAASSAVLDDDAPCHAYFAQRAPFVVLTYLAAGVIAGVNIVLGVVLRELAAFERHHSMINKDLSVALRTFIAYFLNTALVLILVNLNVQGTPENSPFAAGAYGDFSQDWYANVGVQLLVVSIVNIFSFHLSTVALVGEKIWTRNFGDPAVLQRELNERYVGGEWPFAMRTAQILVQACIGIVFGPGLPLLYPLMCFSFGLFFMVDKAAILKFYRSPPDIDDKMAKQYFSILNLAVFVSVGVAIWMLSAPGLFWVPLADAEEMISRGTSLDEVLAYVRGMTSSITGSAELLTRLTLPHTLPLFVLLICIVAFPCAVWISTACFGTTCGKTLLHPASFLAGEVDPDDMVPPVYEARTTGYLRGLPSYNPLKNPRYRRAFGVPRWFAEKHRRVEDVLQLPMGTGVVPLIPESVREAANLGGYDEATLNRKESRPEQS